MTLRNYSSTAAQTTLSSGADASTTTLLVTATTGFPAVPFVLAVDAGAAGQELVLVTSVAGTTLTVTRGFDSTVASAHSTGAVVAHSHAGIDFREANTHVNATTGVHGTTGSLVGTTGAQTLTGKTISADSNTLNGFAASSFLVSDATGKADGSAAQKAIPAGAVVGATDTQTLTNKTLALASNAVEGAVKHTGSGNRLDSTSSAQPSQPATLQIVTGRVSVTLSGDGDTTVTFPGSGFPNGVLHVSAFTVSGTTISPVVVGGNVTKTTMQLLWSGAPSTAVVFTYLAIGY